MDILPVTILCVFLLISQGGAQSGYCPDYTFGDQCRGRCNCDDRTEVCQKITGFCHSGCPWGYISLDCTIQLPLLTSIPTSPWQSKHSIGIRFRQWEPLMGGDGPVVDYMVQHRRSEDTSWIEAVSAIHTANGEMTDVTLGGLKSGTRYIFRIIPVRDPNDFSRPGPEGWAMTTPNVSSVLDKGPIDDQTCKAAVDRMDLLIIICGVLGGIFGLALVALVVISVLYGIHMRHCDNSNHSNSSSNSKTPVSNSSSLSDANYSTSIPSLPLSPKNSNSSSDLRNLRYNKPRVEKKTSSESMSPRLSPILQAGARFGVVLRSQGDGYEMPVNVPQEPVYMDSAYTSLGPH